MCSKRLWGLIIPDTISPIFTRDKFFNPYYLPAWSMIDHKNLIRIDLITLIWIHKNWWNHSELSLNTHSIRNGKSLLASVPRGKTVFSMIKRFKQIFLTYLQNFKVTVSIIARRKHSRFLRDARQHWFTDEKVSICTGICGAIFLTFYTCQEVIFKPFYLPAASIV